MSVSRPRHMRSSFLYDWTALISCLCPPAGSQAVTIDSVSCEAVSSSRSAAHAVRQKDDCTVSLLPIILLEMYIFLETVVQYQI